MDSFQSFLILLFSVLFSLSGVYNFAQISNSFLCFSKPGQTLSGFSKRISTYTINGFLSPDGDHSVILSESCRDGRGGEISSKLDQGSITYEFDLGCDCREPKLSNFSFSIDSLPGQISFSPSVGEKEEFNCKYRSSVFKCTLSKSFNIWFSFLSISACSSLILMCDFAVKRRHPLLSYFMESKALMFIHSALVKKGVIEYCSRTGKGPLEIPKGCKVYRLIEGAPEGEYSEGLDSNFYYSSSFLEVSIETGNRGTRFVCRSDKGYLSDEFNWDSNTIKKARVCVDCFIDGTCIMDYKNGHSVSLIESVRMINDGFTPVPYYTKERCILYGREDVMKDLKGRFKKQTVDSVYEYFPFFFKNKIDDEAILSVLKGSHVNPNRDTYANTEWKLFVSDVFHHMGIKPNTKSKKMGKSKGLNEYLKFKNSSEDPPSEPEKEDVSFLTMVSMNEKISRKIAEKTIKVSGPSGSKIAMCNKNYPVSEKFKLFEAEKGGIIEESRRIWELEDLKIDNPLESNWAILNLHSNLVELKGDCFFRVKGNKVVTMEEMLKNNRTLFVYVALKNTLLDNRGVRIYGLDYKDTFMLADTVELMKKHYIDPIRKVLNKESLEIYSVGRVKIETVISSIKSKLEGIGSESSSRKKMTQAKEKKERMKDELTLRKMEERIKALDEIESFNQGSLLQKVDENINQIEILLGSFCGAFDYPIEAVEIFDKDEAKLILEKMSKKKNKVSGDPKAPKPKFNFDRKAASKALRSIMPKRRFKYVDGIINSLVSTYKKGFCPSVNKLVIEIEGLEAPLSSFGIRRSKFNKVKKECLSLSKGSQKKSKKYNYEDDMLDESMFSFKCILARIHTLRYIFECYCEAKGYIDPEPEIDKPESRMTRAESIEAKKRFVKVDRFYKNNGESKVEIENVLKNEEC